MIFCSGCGTALQDEVIFCPECGTKTDKPEIPSTPVVTKTFISEKATLREETAILTSIPVIETPPPPPSIQFCRNCGKEVKAGAFACMNCGLPPMKANNYCPTCGTVTHPDAVICVQCGVKLTNKASNSTTVVNTKKTYCRNCGKDVLSGAVACLSCGLPPTKGKVYCQSCGSPTNPEAVICIKCGVKLEAASSSSEIRTMAASTPNAGNLQTNNAVRTAAFWGSLMVLLGFFLPWVKGTEIKGSQIASLISSYAEGDDSIYSILLYSMPICAGIFIASALIGNVTRFVSGIRSVPLLSLIILVIIILSKSDNSYNGNSGSFGSNFLDTAGIGLVLTIIGSIMMCFYNPPKISHVPK